MTIYFLKTLASSCNEIQRLATKYNVISTKLERILYSIIETLATKYNNIQTFTTLYNDIQTIAKKNYMVKNKLGYSLDNIKLHINKATIYKRGHLTTLGAKIKVNIYKWVFMLIATNSCSSKLLWRLCQGSYDQKKR